MGCHKLSKAHSLPLSGYHGEGGRQRGTQMEVAPANPDEKNMQFSSFNKSIEFKAWSPIPFLPGASEVFLWGSL